MNKNKNNKYINIYTRVAPVTYNRDTSTVTGILATETPAVVMDWDTWTPIREVLLIDGAEYDDKIPLLDSHSRFEIAALKGSVINIRKEVNEELGDVLVGDYVLSSTADKEKQLIEEGHLTNTSIGYRVYPEFTVEIKTGESKEVNGKLFKNNYEDKLPMYVRTKFKIIENSLVIIGADQYAKLRMYLEQEELNNKNNNNTKGEIKMVENTNQARVDAINKLAETFANKVEGVNLKDAAQLFIHSNRSEREFADFILERQKETAKIPTKSIDLTDKEIKEYDIFRGIRSVLENKNSFEREVSDEYAKRSGVAVKGLGVPYDVALPKYFKRALVSTTISGHTSGASLIDKEHLGNQFIDYLYSAMVLDNITLLPNRKGNVEIPALTGSSGIGWAANEITARSEGSPTVGAKTASPKHGGAFITISKQLLYQSDPPAEQIFVNDLLKSLAVGIQNAVLNGTGSNGQPTGVKNTAGLPTAIDFTGGVTWAKMVAFEAAVDDNFGDDNSMYYVTRRSHRGTLKSTPKTSGTAEFICDGQNIVNGYKVKTSNIVTSGDVFFGDWSQIIVPMWDVVDITIDPYSLATQTLVRIVANQMIDVIVRYPQAFAYGNNFPA